MNLNSFDNSANSGEWLTLVSPLTGEDLPLKLHVLSIDSKPVQKIKKLAIDKQLKKRTPDLSFDQMEDDTKQVYMAAVIGWSGFELPDETGEVKELPFTPANLSTVLFSDRWPWIRKQLDIFINAEVNFIKVSEKT